MRIALILCLLATHPVILLAQDWTPIQRRIPPQGDQLTPEHRAEIEAALKAIEPGSNPDIAIYTDAVRLALRFNEFYKQDDHNIARALLAEAEKQIEAGDPSVFCGKSGLMVRGYTSSIDGSAQPYGLEIPDDLSMDRKLPLYVWLHGRGDKTTNMHFIHQRMSKPGKISPAGAIVAHPFGRHCMGFKHAGEIDVLDVVAAVQNLGYPVDPDRIVLMGFSMGGAGVWHIGAHFPDRWAAMSPGAGFSETAQYNKLQLANYPPAYEQTLWKTYDVPNYTRNLFNLPVTAYSGENDKQIQAARVMEAAFKKHGRTLPHLIGPGMGHKYHPDTLAELMSRMEDALPRTVREAGYLQTPTLQYNRAGGLEALALKEHWQDSRIDWDGETITTTNVLSFRFADGTSRKVILDGDTVEGAAFHRIDDTWKPGADLQGKRPGVQGPIDDAFRSPFVVIPPLKSTDETSAWMSYELAHLEDRWAALFRGTLPIDEVGTVSTRDKRNLVLFGTPETNPWIAMIVDHLPITWTPTTLTVNGIHYDARTHIPVLIYPHPMVRGRYVVVNSGPTFREGHDKTNSQQNPKLPDWAVLNIEDAPSDVAAGKVVDAGFFDEDWQF